ncbi:hypothetical protein [Streptomyces sp. NPDC005438]|uniref:hypothetical protein n=1 Tax=Streptomyces sp. NPDC005438 TaxID=3156880 RepID=UPI0033A83086
MSGGHRTSREGAETLGSALTAGVENRVVKGRTDESRNRCEISSRVLSGGRVVWLRGCIVRTARRFPRWAAVLVVVAVVATVGCWAFGQEDSKALPSRLCGGYVYAKSVQKIMVDTDDLPVDFGTSKEITSCTVGNEYDYVRVNILREEEWSSEREREGKVLEGGVVKWGDGRNLGYYFPCAAKGDAAGEKENYLSVARHGGDTRIKGKERLEKAVYSMARVAALKRAKDAGCSSDVVRGLEQG